MGVSLEEIERQARTLVAEERAQLAEALLESLHVPIADVEAAWAQEIEDRVAAFDRGEMPAYPAEEVFGEARRLSR
jgi:putative addiction module component (TIGR02574 family)